MTGSGTQADPYIVDNWPDLNTAMTQGGAYVELVPNCVIDLNDTHPEGFTSRIDWRGHLDGKNGTIRNLSTSASKMFGTDGITFLNLNILNFRGVEGIFERINTNSPLHLYNCKFSGRLDKADTWISVSALYIHRCSFNVMQYGNNRGAGFSWWGNYDGADINYNRIEIGGTVTGSFDTDIVSNCYIGGTINGRVGVGGETNVVDCTCTQLTADFRCSNILVNSDKCSDISSESGVIPVTTAQMKDAAYLASLGFPIQT